MSEEHKTRRPLIDKIGEVVTQYPGWGSTVDFSYSPGNYENLNLFLRILEGPEDELEEFYHNLHHSVQHNAHILVGLTK